MKKSFFTFMLAIVSGVWMTSEACLSSITTDQDGPYMVQTGILGHAGYPCFEGEECPMCLTLVLIANGRTYYPTTDNAQLRAQLDELYYYQGSISLSGIVFERENYHFIQVSSIDTNPAPLRLNSLCDEWNILEVSNVTCGGCEEYRTYHSQLTKDTIIQMQRYAQLIEDGAYRGALREGLNRDIYYIPAGSAHEYLLYAFNAQEGDQLTNLWIGGSPADSPDGWAMTVEEIQETTPRTFVLSTGYTHTDEGIENYPLYITWIEGVGMDGPVGDKRCVGCANSTGYGVLCAYKNGEHIFTSDLGEQYGCEYNYDPYSTPADTIPLFSYTGDDPGSSTVDPVDPNQVVVTLKGDELTIKETSGDVITYSLQKESSNNAPKHMPMLYANTFQNSVSVELTEEGLYQLNLSNPLWGYRIYGIFNYPQKHDAIDETVVPAPAAQKIIRNGQLLIRKGEKVYTVQGTAINE